MNKHTPKIEAGFALILFVSVFLLTMQTRNSRLYSDSVIHTGESVELFLGNSSDVDVVIRQFRNKIDIFDEDLFRWAASTLGWRTFRPGRYLIPAEITYQELFSKLGRGLQDPLPVTVIPGTDMERLSERLARQLRPDSTSFREIFKDSSEIALSLELTGEELFSRMLPNTYEMYWTSAPGAAIRKIYREFEKVVLVDYRREMEEHFLSEDEILILASIVEWEARNHEEKPTIAGLYINRLKRDMPLQADPTVIYAIGERRRLLYEDYRYDHPYNTYLIRGLPPGPITNPSLQSILAVLEPEDHDYLYMVATPEGSHRFSKTFQEHREASEEWRRWIREQFRIKREREQKESNQNQL